MFRVRHGLLAVRDMGTLSREICGRKATLEVSGAGRGQAQLTDIAGQFQRIAAIADGQKDYLQGVIEFYRTRTSTKMTVAAERLAVIAVTLPITALSSVPGMNIIVSTSAHWLALTVLLVVMLVMVPTILLVWTRRRDAGNTPAPEHQQLTHASSSTAGMPVSMLKPSTWPSRISQPGRPFAGPHPLGGRSACPAVGRLSACRAFPAGVARSPWRAAHNAHAEGRRYTWHSYRASGLRQARHSSAPARRRRIPHRRSCRPGRC